jgi:alkanesulfonate monooxygenase SsuD/methylene tetrahydromethanopterin reductase-like flavin-dependent oxidoreductase (luciferase family)
VPGAIERAARLGDGFLGTGTPQCGIDAFRRQIELFDRAAREAGRGSEPLPMGFHVNGWVSPDGAVPPSVLRAMWHQIGTYMLWHAVDDGLPSDGPPPLDERRIRERAFLGTPAEVVEQARPWIEAFAGRELHVVVRLHYPGMQRDEAEHAMRLFATEVLSPLKRLSDPGATG